MVLAGGVVQCYENRMIDFSPKTRSEIFLFPILSNAKHNLPNSGNSLSFDEKNSIIREKPLLSKMKNLINSHQFQKDFLLQVQERLPHNEKIARFISTYFDLSTSAAHRRTSCEALIPLNELLQLSVEFGISIDEILFSQPKSGVAFERGPRITSVIHLKHHLEQILTQIETLRRVSDALMYYAARDLPLFFYFRYPALAAFKVNVWLSDSHMQNHQIDLQLIPELLIKLGKQLSLSYNELSTVEIWSPQTLSNVYNQVAYFHRAGYLAGKDALDILDDVRKIIDDRERTALDKNKQGEYRAELYICDYLMMGNGALAKIGNTQTAWVSYSGVDLIRTSNTGFCTDYEQAFKWHIQQGVGISGSATDKRTQFFDDLRIQLEQTKSKILRREG